jgi:hypothetical protein
MAERAATLAQLADRIARSPLHTALCLTLDLLSPIDVISSQLAQFARPLVSGTGLEPYASLLADRASWPELRRLLSAP